VVVEDKRAFIEDAIKSILYRTANAPAVYGKRFDDGSALFSPLGELDSDTVQTGSYEFSATLTSRIWLLRPDRSGSS
jgi:TPP-dependent indolepyruvate ferredoxin oxidoreductase alpha subunit